MRKVANESVPDFVACCVFGGMLIGADAKGEIYCWRAGAWYLAEFSPAAKAAVTAGMTDGRDSVPELKTAPFTPSDGAIAMIA